MNVWKKNPLAKVAIVFIIGLFLSVELNFKLGSASSCIVVVISALIISLQVIKKTLLKTRIQGSLWLLLFLTLGIWRGEIHRTNIHENWLSNHTIESSDGFFIQLEGELTEKKNSYKSEAKIVSILSNDSIIYHQEKVLCYFNKRLNLKKLLNTELLYTSRKPSIIQGPKNPGEFNYKKYLSGLGIQTQFYLDSNSIHSTTTRTKKNISQFFVDIKNSSLETLKSIGIHDESFGVIAALVFGEKDFLDSDTYRSYGAAGATHVLAVSGLHVGLIYLILLKICSPFKKKKFGKALTLLIGLTGLWFYAAITGFSPSVLRASTMFSAILIGQQVNKSTSIYNTLAASAMLLLFISPNLLMEVGFQLSYSAVLGILLIQPWLYKLWTPGSWLVDKAWQLSTVSIAAQLGTFPLGMLYFHQFPNYFLLSNLIVIPAATFILYLTLVTLAFSFSEVISKFLGLILQSSVEYLNFFISKIQSLPHAISEGIDISILECFILYGFLIFILRVFIRKKFNSLKHALTLMIFFLALQCHESKNQSEQCFMMVHSVRNDRAISLVQGREVSFLASEKFLTDSAKIKFHISHFWNKIGIESIDYKSLEIISNENDYSAIDNGRIFFNNIHLVVKFDPNSGHSGTHAFINKSYSEKTNESVFILDGKTRFNGAIATQKTVLNAQDYALVVD